MKMASESPLTVAQRAAIQEVRARYERDEITVEQFKSALDAITEAADVGAVQAVIAELPSRPHSALAAFDPAPLAPVEARTPTVTTSGRGVKRIAAFMGETRRAGKPWTLAPRSRISCTMGEVLVDLRQAKLPPQGHIRVSVVMGETRILVPRGVRVTAHTRVIMGEATTLGENVSGLIAAGEEEHEPLSGEPIAELVIDSNVIMGELKIMLVDQSSASIAELAREVLKEALAGVRDGLVQGRAQQAYLNPGPNE
jgi:hypothetical protein